MFWWFFAKKMVVAWGKRWRSREDLAQSVGLGAVGRAWRSREDFAQSVGLDRI